MMPLVGIVLVLCATLLCLHYDVQHAGDRATFVPPPESVVENFVRQLQTNRFPRALPQLSRELQESVTADSLEALTHRLEAGIGGIVEVQGEPIHTSGDAAEATAVVDTDQRKGVELTFPLEREQDGLWKITRLDGLAGQSGGV